jgi:hypothetical protein
VALLLSSLQEQQQQEGQRLPMGFFRLKQVSCNALRLRWPLDAA